MRKRIAPQFIFLFGHRKQHGKDTCVQMVERILDEWNLTCQTSYFAKMLKEQAAEKYGLDFNRMGEEDYKNSKPAHLNGLTVRDVLIKEGCGARAIWQNVWAYPVYKEILLSKTHVGLVSDFRYPNECGCFDECFDIINSSLKLKMEKPKIVKVLVHKPTGKFVNDGADDQLPDLDPYWDFTILNDDTTENWKENLEKQLKNMLELYLTGKR